MVLAVIGFCCPMFKALGFEANGFKFINFDNSGFVTIGALLIIAGAIAGVVLVIGFTTNGGIYKSIGKQFIKHATVGFYLVLAGWVVALVGQFSNK